ncbi:MAG: hypothetical protein ACI85I_001861 [Arenicella sp.]|jgi:hypothetical protein
MRKSLYILCLFLLSCENQSDKTSVQEGIILSDNTKEETENSIYRTNEDTVFIGIETGESFKLTKEDFNEIVDNHPEFFQEFTENPDQLYYNNNDKDGFGSEVGQDSYYALYAYFLKQKNGVEEYSEQRKKIIDIYSKINSIFGHLQYGGTYFGHQYTRILGYAEYSIYLLPKDKNDFVKTYDITKQKNLYIKSLYQLISDEINIDSNTFGKNKIERNNVINVFVNQIDSLITDNFYLQRAQEFQYSHYEYY